MSETPRDDPRRHSPAAERNGGPILEQLQRLLPASGLMRAAAQHLGPAGLLVT